MTYQDTWATCTKCGRQFVFRVEEQRQQEERGGEIEPPELCPSCRLPAPPERHDLVQIEHRPEPESEREPKEMLGDGPHEGTVKWYDEVKGYGFIVHPSGEEFFFHRTGVAPGEMPSFPDGTRVTYFVEHTTRGPQAVDVARMDK